MTGDTDETAAAYADSDPGATIPEAPDRGDRYRYDELTWPEIDAAAVDGDMVVVPVGATEDHGPHLPVDVDRVIVEEICERTVADRDDCLLFPTVDHGYLPHHADFPGGISIGWETFVDYCIDLCVSLVHHGFSKLLLVNGHGSNHHLLNHVVRQVALQFDDVHCAMLSWWELEEVRDVAAAVRDAGPHGTSHAGELETSVYLAIHPERVDMARAPRDVAYPDSPYFNAYDLAGERDPDWSTSVTMMEWWSTLSVTGVRGDASVATAEKGVELLAAAVAGLDAVLDGFAAYPHRKRVDHHSPELPTRDDGPFTPR